MESQYDPKLFLQMQVQGASSTVRIPVPAQEHLAVITKVDVSRWVKKDDPTKSGMRLDLEFSIDDANVKALLGRDKVTLTQGIMLDLLPSAPGAMPSLDMSKGKNVQLGRLREAVGLNDSSKPFGFPMLEGQPVRILVGHTPSDRPGAMPGDVYENVVAYSKAG